MKQLALVLVGLTLVGSSIAAGPLINCASGYTPTAGACTAGQTDQVCISTVCTTSNGTQLVGNNGQCDTEAGTRYCAVCCPNTNAFIYPDSNRLITPFDVGDRIDCVYNAETGPPNGVSTDCDCGNGYIYSHFADNVIYGGWQSYLEWGTQASFGNPDLITNCGSANTSTTCNLTLHAMDGQGIKGWGSEMAVLTGLSLVYTAVTGVEVGTLPTSIATTTSAGIGGIATPTLTSSNVAVQTPTSSNNGPVPTPTSTSPSTSTSPAVTSTSAAPTGGSSGLGAGAIAGIVVGSVLGIALIGLGGFLFWLMRRRRGGHDAPPVYVSSDQKPFPETAYHSNNANSMPYNNTPYQQQTIYPDPSRISEVPGSPVIGSPQSAPKAWGGS